MRKCFFCGAIENLEESHDIPCYLFINYGNRQGQKNEADKHGRHLLCKKHHKEYEDLLNFFLKKEAKKFSIKYFKKEKDGNSI